MASGIDLNTGAPSDRGTAARGPSTARLIELVDERRQASLRYNHGVFKRLQNWYESYRGYWQGRSAQFRNNVTIPFTFAMIQSDVARKVQTTFGQWPIVSFEGYAPEDEARAKRTEILISAQMKDCDSLLQAVDFMLQADICGTGVARIGWRNELRKTKQVRYETIAPGLRIPVEHEFDATVFNGPVWSTVDRLDFWQEPAKKRIEDMNWVIHRYWLDLDEMLDDAASDEPYFDPSAVRLLKTMGEMSSAGHSEYLARKTMYRNEYEYMARQSSKFNRPVEIWEMQGTVPIDFAPDGVRHRCVCIANGRVVVKNRPGVLPNRKMFRSYAPMMDPYSFDGVGKAEIAYGPQMTVNRLANQKLDAIDLMIDPMWKASESANINTQNLFTRAGRIITVGGSDVDALQPLEVNPGGVQQAYQEIGQLWEFMQLGVGINDIVMGLQSGQRETARGVLSRQENVMTRLSFEARILEEQFVEPLANDFRDLDRYLLDLPHEVKVLGSIASINPVTGLPYLPERVTIGEEDLAPDYRARAVGASRMMSRSVRQQNLVSLLQMMNSNPVLMQMVNWANFARQMFELFDFQNVEELLVNQMPMINQMAQETGQDPMMVANMVSQGLPGLDPGLTQALGNNNPNSLVGTLTGGNG